MPARVSGILSDRNAMMPPAHSCPTLRKSLGVAVATILSPSQSSAALPARTRSINFRFGIQTAMIISLSPLPKIVETRFGREELRKATTGIFHPQQRRKMRSRPQEQRQSRPLIPSFRTSTETMLASRGGVTEWEAGETIVRRLAIILAGRWHTG